MRVAMPRKPVILGVIAADWHAGFDHLERTRLVALPRVWSLYRERNSRRCAFFALDLFGMVFGWVSDKCPMTKKLVMDPCFLICAQV